MTFIYYRASREFSFNFFYFWYNRDVALETITLVFEYWWLYLAISIIMLFSLYYASLTLIQWTTFTNTKVKRYGLYSVFIILLLLSIQSKTRVETYVVVSESFFHQSSIRDKYLDYYWRWIYESIEQNTPILQNLEESNENQNIFFLHLESLNGALVSEEITPNLVNIANRDGGTLFPNVQSNSVQTIRGQFHILCSVLPSFFDNLHKLKKSDSIVCLPKILKKLGYKTLFFKSHTLDFSDTGTFMRNLGFDEVHANDIMKPGDIQTDWGHREDIFYQRVLEYLEDYKDKKLFVYIAVSSTNHPYFQLHSTAHKEFIDIVPYPNIEKNNFRQSITNTTWLQDYFLGGLLTNLTTKYGDNSDVYIFGDHSWPIGIHNNTYNDVNGFQDNFITSLAILKSSSNKPGSINNHFVSQNDIMPTVLSSFNINNMKTIGQDLLATTPLKNRCLISVQPFSQLSISAIEYPIKYLYNILDNTVSIYNIAEDPDEKSSLSVKTITDGKKLLNCLESFWIKK